MLSAPERFAASAAARALHALRAPALVAAGLALTTTASVTVVAIDVAGSSPEVGPSGIVASSSPGEPPAPVETAESGEALGRPGPQPAVQPLTERVEPDVIVTLPAPLPPERVGALAPEGRAVAFRSGTVRLGSGEASALGVDPSSFRPFTAKGTAEADAVWQAVARGEVIASHDFGKRAGLELGGDVVVTPKSGGEPVRLRVGAFATTGVPGGDLVVDERTGERLGLPQATAVLVAAPEGQDPVVVAERVRKAAGEGAQVDLLAPPAKNPVAFLTGSKAAKAFGAFSYRYYADGTIEPDAAWVRRNIVTTTVPIMGRVTCHRLMVPQLRAALQEVQDSGLGHLLKTYDGCYVPRFIARNPDNSISLHTWGIAIDMDAATNYRGIRGTMDDRIVAIFKKWGFRWGGDWAYTDPMHFELGALLISPEG
ncbi:MAG TPA: M15 family metallopeptidase [Mycobacteriales bacterium]|nr:M15 family metallopeptidase [Mycobacteriales bacterium]